MSPLVSVVTPVYNGARFLGECIESVLAQSFTDFEHVILDNASTDDTRTIVEGYAIRDSRIRYRRNCTTVPMLQNWNKAMSLMSSASKYCKVVHADDTLMPDCLARMVDVAEAHPTVVIVGAYRLDGNEINMVSIPSPVRFVEGRELCRRRLLGEWRDLFGSPSSIMYRADRVRERSAFYNLDNPHADTEICFDLLRNGDYGFVHEVLTRSRRHQAAETTQARRMGTHGVARLEIAHRYGGDFLSPAEQRNAVDLQLRFEYRFLGANVVRLVREDAFRRYHFDALRDCGVQPSWPRIVGEAALGAVRNLYRSLRSVLTRVVPA